MKSSKKIIIAVVLAFATAALVGCGNNSETGDAPEKIVIGTQNLMNVEAIANAEDYYAETIPDVDVEIKNFSAGKDLNQAMAAGEIDFAVLGSSPVAVGLSSGIDYKVIYSTAMLTNTEALVAKDGSGIKTAKDLEGKKIATTFTSTTHYTLLSLIKEKGIDLEKVEIVDMEPDKIVAAWQRGDIDAACTWNPALSRMANDGGKVVVTSGEVGALGYPVADLVVVRTEFAEAYPDYVVSYLDAILKAEELFANDKDVAYGIIADTFETTPEDAKIQMADKYVRGQEQIDEDYFANTFVNMICDISEFLKEQQQIPEALDKNFVEQHIDSTYLKKALEN